MFEESKEDKISRLNSEIEALDQQILDCYTPEAVSLVSEMSTIRHALDWATGNKDYFKSIAYDQESSNAKISDAVDYIKDTKTATMDEMASYGDPEGTELMEDFFDYYNGFESLAMDVKSWTWSPIMGIYLEGPILPYISTENYERTADYYTGLQNSANELLDLESQNKFGKSIDDLRDERDEIQAQIDELEMS